MPQIVVEDLVKTYRIAERQPGMWGAMRGLVHIAADLLGGG